MAHIFLGVCAAIFVCWAVFIVRYLNKVIFKSLRYLNHVDENIEERFKPIQRKDRHLWNIPEMYICGIFLLPLRLAGMLLSMTFLVTVMYLVVGKPGPNQHIIEYPRWRAFLWKKASRFVGRTLLFCGGIHWIEKKQVRIADFDASYPTKPGKETRAPIIISNHVTTLDAIYHVSSNYFPSFLSKLEVSKIPLFGPCARGFQTIFVDRDDRENKNAVCDALHQRGELIRQGKNLPPIAIFPEGTSTNGEYLISFKKGAFEPLLPIKIICLEWPVQHFSMSLDSIPQAITSILMMCQFRNSLRVTEFDTFDPEYLNLSRERPDDWQIYARKVKDIMLAAMPNVKNSEIGYRDIKDYDNFVTKIAMKTGESVYRKVEEQPKTVDSATKKSQ